VDRGLLNAAGVVAVLASLTASFGLAVVAGAGPLPNAAASPGGFSVTEVLHPFAPPLVNYSVNFSERGLPSGLTWNVTVNGVFHSLVTNGSTDNLTFVEANGTYPYSVAGISGWNQVTVPYSGSVVVNGASVTEPTLVYTQETYLVTFTETGLPSGTPWWVNVTGGPSTMSTTGSLSYSEANGTYGYTVATANKEYAAAGGSYTVAGAAVGETAAFSPVTYAVTFTESGLPSGTTWSVTLNGSTQSASTASIAFAEKNGTFAYSIGVVSGYVPGTSSGSVTVTGAAVPVAVSFTQVTYSVVFSESGLPSGLTWRVTLGGSPQSLFTDGSTDSLTFVEPNGSFAYSVAGISGWNQATAPYSGTVVVNGGSVTEPTLAYSRVTYSVTFTESGLPAGTSWSVTLNGSHQSSTATTISFTEPNGTYGYTVGVVPGYVPASSSGSAVVSGAALNVPVAFTRVTYSVTFTETGLPSGSSWSVTLNGTHQGSTTTTIIFTEPNGTFGYTVGVVPGYAPGASSGSVTVNGAPASVPVAFTRVTYAVTYTETGLPVGTSWSVTLNGSTQSATTASIAFTEPNGTFGYRVGTVPGYEPSVPSGSVVVNGSAVPVTVSFSRLTYSVTFTESGLPTGTSWSVTLNGTHQSSTTPTIVFPEPNGTYGYTIGVVPGYAPGASSGSVTVNGAAAPVPVSFTRVTYVVTFTESGLPVGTSWSVTLNGSTESATTTSIAFTEPNGTFSYQVGVVPGYKPSLASGSVVVNGAAVPVSVSFNRVTYSVQFTESGLPTGTSWSVTLNGSRQSSTTSTTSFTEPNGTFGYSIGVVPGYAPGVPSGSVTVNGANASVAVAFSRVTYSVTFTESGLPSGTTWSVTLNGSTQSASTASIAFTEPNGTYGYTIGVVPGYQPTVSSGSVVVNGAAVPVSVSFARATYSVTFTEAGLPIGTSWSVTLNGSHQSSTTTSIAFTEPNGTFGYTIGVVPGHQPTSSSGSVVVNGAAVPVSVSFVRVTYVVTFTETGLPSGTSWSVTLNGSSENATTASITFPEPNGTFAYRIGVVPGYQPTASSGSVTVNGAAVPVTVTFGRTTYSLVFSESGLPSGLTWQVTVGGAPQSLLTNGGTDSLTFVEANGTYPYSVAGISGWNQVTVPYSGSVVVNGASVTEPTLVYTQETYLVTFTETGLPSGTPWWVNVTGGPSTMSTTGSLSYSEANGTYGYTVATANKEYAAAGGSYTVAGAAVGETAAFSPVTYAVTFTESGLPSGTTWSVTLNGSTQSASTASIAFAEKNGTFAYSIGVVSGYVPSKSSGSVTVTGASVPVAVTFTRVTYSVTFTETGLPSGSSWSVTLNGTHQGSTTTTIIFTEPNGTFGYTVGVVPGYAPGASSGSVTVNGAAVSQPVTFSRVTYAVTYTETGLPVGTSWSVTLNGSTQSATTASIAFTEPNGTYGYTIGVVPGYQPTVSSGSVVVNGAAVPVAVTFTRVTYAVTFTESGLPSGTSWSVTLNGSTESATTTSIVFTEPNGTFGYRIGVVPGYLPGASSGSVTVAGSAASVGVTFARATYAVTFSESGLPSGLTWQVTVGGLLESLVTDGSTDSLSFAEVNGTYSYSISGISGWQESTIASTGSVAVSGAPVAEPTLAYARVTYAVTFSETGLPSGTSWSVTLNGSTESATTTSIGFTVPNGTFSYRIGVVAGYQPGTSSGSLTVNGAAVPTSVTFTRVTYSLVFSESGLPSGLTWQVTVGGSPQSLVTNGGTDSLTFTEPNGSYAYSIGAISGWSEATLPTSGTVVVNGTTVNEPTLAYTSVTYSITFSETGLPSATSWSVTFDGSRQSATGPTIAFAEPNGSYGYTIGVVAGYAPLSSSGSVIVNGGAVTVTVPFTRVTYSVTFTESGLPGGTSWSVTLNGTLLTSTASTIVFAEPNGSFSYQIGVVFGYQPGVASGSVTVNGAAASATVAFTRVTYAVTFTESGLPVGSSWSVTLNGVLGSATTTTIAFTEPNGTFSYQLGVVPGYAPAVPSGSVTVAGSASSVAVSFTRVTYSVTFTETGLPGGTSWSVTLNGTLESSTGPSIAFAEPNGTYAYRIGVVPGYSPTVASGLVTVSGAALAVGVTFGTVTYSVVFSESGLPSGLTWQVTVGGSPQSLVTNGGTDSLTFTEPNGSYAYSITDISGWNQVALAYSGSVVVNGATVTEPTLAYTAVTYSVTFTESGLPAGTSWSVVLHGQTLSSSTTSIVFSEPNGTYGYTIDVVAGYAPGQSSGSVAVNGAAASVLVTFTRVTYSVTFTESGLASGTSWSVSLNGTLQSSTSTSIAFSVPNGTYTYQLGTVPGYTPTTASGSVTVNGAADSVPVTFSRVTYSVVFSESGLPSGLTWQVTVGGLVQSLVTNGSTDRLLFSEANGSYSYSVAGISGWNQVTSPYSGTVLVSGGPVTETTLVYARVTYSITFTESGLPGGTNWSVTLNGSTVHSVGASISFLEPNGSYAYRLGVVPGYTSSPPSGSAAVTGAAVAISVPFVRVTYSVTFSESGLPSGLTWQVTVGGSVESLVSNGATDSLAFTEPNGSYSYSIAGTSGWNQPTIPYSGTVVVNGTAVAEPTALYAQETYSIVFTESGLPVGTTWSVTLGSATRSANSSAISFTEPNGTFSFRVGIVPGYAPASSSGSVAVNGATVSVTVAFTPVTYAVTFTEGGLPIGTTWSVTFNGSTLDSTGSTIAFESPNGTYAYTIGVVSGWVPAHSSGSATVSGGPVSVAVSFTRVTYSVVFSESGLPTGLTWQVTVGGSLESLVTNGSTDRLTFTEPNGSFGYSVAGLSGWNQISLPYSGTVTVTGASVTETTLVYMQVTYAVTFTEYGLPAGTLWSVTLGGSTLSSNASAIAFTEPNGTFAYRVGIVPGYEPSPSTGSVIVNGLAVSVSLPFTETTYLVTFSETGLAAGTSWSIRLNGRPESSTASSIELAEPNGTYNFTVGAIAGYTSTPVSGTVVVNASAESVSITFQQVTYPVTFTESGLPAGTSWSVTVDGVPQSSTASTISFAEPNGTARYTIGIVPGYVPAHSSGSITVVGQGLSVSVSFTRLTYAVVFSESGLPAGLTWQVTVAGAPESLSTNGGTDSLSFAEPNGSYAYAIGGLSGWEQPTLPSSGTLVVNGGPIAEPTAIYTQVTYAITFSETGLPSGTSWSVVLDGTNQSSTGTSLTFDEPNGTFPYLLGHLPGYGPSPSVGTIVVRGAGVTVPIQFSSTTYTVTFSESGLPAGMGWSLKIGGTTLSSTGGPLTFTLLDGTYTYAFGPTAGFVPVNASRTVTVSGATVTVPVAFTVAMYTVTWTESGLPAWRSWSVAFDGVLKSTSASTSGPSIRFSVPNGSYAFLLAGSAGFRVSFPTAAEGTIAVTGSNLGLPVIFVHAQTFTITFRSIGLGKGTPWCVTIGVRSCTTASALVFRNLTPGFYDYAIGTFGGMTDLVTYAGHPTSATGVTNVSGSELFVVRFAFAVTFTETGLPTGTEWNATAGIVHGSSTGTTIVLYLTNGTYAFHFGRVTGYVARPGYGRVWVTGWAMSEVVQFELLVRPLSPSHPAVDPLSGWAVEIARFL
jgi:hypothetical protein